MPIKFQPNYALSPKIVTCLLRIEAAKQQVAHLPLNPVVLSSLRETARLFTTHYSTMIEGNSLQPEQIKTVLTHKGHFPGRERDEGEVKGYYAALTQIEQWTGQKIILSEKIIQTIHALVMHDGKAQVQPSIYRDGQNVIRDSTTRTIIYMPPEAKDVKALMIGLVEWTKNNDLPCPIIASIVHYQFATIHPYYDGNGRTARLLTTLVLHLGGYDLKGLYSLEEYYAKNLGAYYSAISIGPSHNYYMGRAEADITPWIEYFIEGMAISFENVLKQMHQAEQKGLPDHAELLRKLDPKKRKALELFTEHEIITNKQIGQLFGFKPRTSAALCAQWVEDGFLIVVDPSNRARKYELAKKFTVLLT